MAEPVTREPRRGPESAILIIIVLAVVALLVWFIVGRGRGGDTVDVDINVPGAEGGGGREGAAGSMP